MWRKACDGLDGLYSWASRSARSALWASGGTKGKKSTQEANLSANWAQKTAKNVDCACGYDLSCAYH